MANATLSTADARCILDELVDELEEALEIVLERRRYAPSAVRHHIAVAIAALIDETKAGAIDPRVFHKRAVELWQEVAACERVH